MKAISYMSKRFCKLPCTRTKEYKNCSYKEKKVQKIDQRKKENTDIKFSQREKKMKMKKKQ